MCRSIRPSTGPARMPADVKKIAGVTNERSNRPDKAENASSRNAIVASSQAPSSSTSLRRQPGQAIAGWRALVRAMLALRQCWRRHSLEAARGRGYSRGRRRLCSMVRRGDPQPLRAADGSVTCAAPVSRARQRFRAAASRRPCRPAVGSATLACSTRRGQTPECRYSGSPLTPTIAPIG